MKKYFLVLMLSVSLIGCFRSGSNNAPPPGPAQLAVPANLNISVTGRLMTVTWDAVNHASGYIINTKSAGCGSGNRIVNTATKNVTTLTGTATNSETAENGITNRGNGFVTFTGATSFTIWLMPEAGSETEVMAASLTAEIMAVGDGVTYTDSGYSSEAILNKADYRQ